MNRNINLHAIVIIGNICSGKTSLGRQLESISNYRYLSFGEIKRNALQCHNEVSLKIEREVQNGNTLPENDCMQVILDYICNYHIIISGFPITEREYDVFIKYFIIDAVIFIECPENIIKARYYKRAVCQICNYPGEKGDFCPIHQIEMTEKDQNKNNIELRLSLFKNRIMPFLKKHNWTQPFLKIQSNKNTTIETIRWLKRIGVL